MSFINTSTNAYPITRVYIESALPDVVWADGNPPTPYALVLEALSPPTPAAGQVLVEGEPELVGDDWRQTWTVDDAPAPRVLDRLRYILALQNFPPAISIIFGAAAALDEDDEVRLYFEHTPHFDRDDPRYDAMETALGSTEEGADTVFAYGATLAP